jgi:hypothetical protein
MIRSKIVLPLLFCSILISCKKEPGPGGLASIQGKVYAYDFTSGKDLLSEGYLGDMRVYIGTADGSTSFDDVRTSFDGSFEFPMLRKGSYKVWVFAESDTLIYTPVPDNRVYYMQTVEITEKKQKVILPDLKVNI